MDLAGQARHGAPQGEPPLARGDGEQRRVAFVERGTAEWDAMWAELKREDALLRVAAAGLENPLLVGHGASEEAGSTTSEHPRNGECWQYMGSFRREELGCAWLHEFRHRDHPESGSREHRWIAATAGFAPALR